MLKLLPKVQNDGAAPSYLMSEVKKLFAKQPLQGAQGRFFAALRVLQRLLRKTKTPLY
jgi:hypothetical protein